MIIFKRIFDQTDALFDPCWQLYQDAFPSEERRSLELQLTVMKSEYYRFEALLHDDQLVGFLCWWDFDDLSFLDHLATFPAVKGYGYGGKTLKQFMERCGKPLILEVEPPDDELKKRRIKYYESLGFLLNDYEYAQPPYSGDKWVPLKIMTYPNLFTPKMLDDFKERYFPKIHLKFN